MATFSQTNIKCKDVETVLAELKKYLPTDREIWLDTRKEWFYNLPHDENLSEEKNITLVISKNLSKDWVEVEFDFQGNLYLYDEILRRISKNLETDILLAYYSLHLEMEGWQNLKMDNWNCLSMKNHFIINFIVMILPL
jgi:hypothetical protein